MSEWTFFSNYGHVLVCLARDPRARLRDVALEVGITERAVQKIVRDMQDAGYLTVTKQGRRNRYRINKRKGLRHPLESNCTVGRLLALLAKTGKPAPVEPERVESVEEAEDAGAPPAGGTVPTPVPAPVAAEDTESEKRREREKEKKRAPIDTREQGTLF